MDTRVLVSVMLRNERNKSGLEAQYSKAIGSFRDTYHIDYVNRVGLIDDLIVSSSDYFVYVKYATVMNLSTFEFEVLSIEDCIRYNVIGLHLDPSDLLDDGVMPINIFGYSKSLRWSKGRSKDGCVPFMYDGKPIKIGSKFSESLIYYYITYGELELQLHINIENNAFKLGDFIQTDGFRDRDDLRYQWYGIEIGADSLCEIHLYNQDCAYGYGVCIIGDLVDDIIVPNGIKEVRISGEALSRRKTIVLPVSIDNIIIEYDNTVYGYLKNYNKRIKTTVIASNSIKDETLIGIVKNITGYVHDARLHVSMDGIIERDRTIEFVRKNLFNLEFY